MNERLIKEIGNCCGPDAFPDAFHMTAEIIEDSLIKAGAKPGTDYTILDLFKLAQPFLLHRYKNGELSYVGYEQKRGPS